MLCLEWDRVKEGGEVDRHERDVFSCQEQEPGSFVALNLTENSNGTNWQNKSEDLTQLSQPMNLGNQVKPNSAGTVVVKKELGEGGSNNGETV